MDTATSRVIGSAAIITAGVGTLNSFIKHKKPPAVRFLVGTGATYVILSALAEGEPELAKGLAIAVATTVVLGDGGGVLTYFAGPEIDTQSPKVSAGPTDSSPSPAYASKVRLVHPISSVNNGLRDATFVPDTIPLQAGF